MSNSTIPQASYNLNQFQIPETLRELDKILESLSKKHKNITILLSSPVESKQERVRDEVIGLLGILVNLNEWKDNPTTFQQIGNNLTGAGNKFAKNILEKGFGIPSSLVYGNSDLQVAIYKDLVAHLIQYGYHGPYGVGNVFLELDQENNPTLHRYMEGKRLTISPKSKSPIKLLDIGEFRL